MIELICILLFGTFTLTLLCYYLYFWTKLLTHKNKQNFETSTQPPISVVISARNEEYNLKANLESILSQDYPNFEVVVVDDGSEDDTYYILRDFQIKYPNLNIIKLASNVNFFKGKKFPLSIGIRSAKHQHLLLCDADCKAVSNQWIKEIANKFTNEKKVILAYGKLSEQPGLLNKIIRFETLLTAIQYFSFALRGIPYMGVGRNLAYTKDLFEKNKGFSKHYNIISGDDDLFVNSVANKTNTDICISKESFTISKPKTSFSAWWIQKRRHFSSSKLYKTNHKILLATYNLAVIGFYATFATSLLFTNFIILSITLFAFKSLMFLFLLYKTSKKFEEKKLWPYSIFLELLLVLLSSLLILSNFIRKPDKWR